MVIISKTLNLPLKSIENVMQLLDEGYTIPFISRYRKEYTGGLDEVQIASIQEQYEHIKEMGKRKDTIKNTINGLGKLIPELKRRIEDCWDAAELEDIYLPYKPKRRTRAQVAREHGLEPLSAIMLLQRERDIENVARRFVNGEVKDVETAIKGAQDIIAETVSEDERSRQQIRRAFGRKAVIVSKVIKTKADTDGADKFKDYFNFSEQLRHCSSHRLLAIRRGENEGVLRVTISPDDTECVELLKRNFVRGYGKCSSLVAEAVNDAYKRLLKPAIENEFATSSKVKADDDAIAVFTENLRQLLLSPPLGPKKVMGVDPGIRTGCKIVCLDEQGNLLRHDVIFPFSPSRQLEAARKIREMIDIYGIEAISIGNGTASRETAAFFKALNLDGGIRQFVVSEDGASVYSASKAAREEFPDEDVTVRGAISIGRRLMDPLAELVKIDPRASE